MRTVHSVFCDIVILQTPRGLYPAIRCLHTLVLGGPVSFEGVGVPDPSFAGLFFAAPERCVPGPGPRNFSQVLYIPLLVVARWTCLAIPDLLQPVVPGFLASFAVPELLAVAAAVAAGFLILAAATPGVLVFVVVPGLNSVVAPWIRVAVSDGSAAAAGRLDAVPGESAVLLDVCIVAPDNSAAVPDEGFVEASDVRVAALGGLVLVAYNGVLVVTPG